MECVPRALDSKKSMACGWVWYGTIKTEWMYENWHSCDKPLSSLHLKKKKASSLQILHEGSHVRAPRWPLWATVERDVLSTHPVGTPTVIWEQWQWLLFSWFWSLIWYICSDRQQPTVFAAVCEINMTFIFYKYFCKKDCVHQIANPPPPKKKSDPTVIVVVFSHADVWNAVRFVWTVIPQVRVNRCTPVMRERPRRGPWPPLNVSPGSQSLSRLASHTLVPFCFHSEPEM